MLFRLDGNPVRRRGADDAEVAGAQERELEGSRNRGGGQRQGIDRCLQMAEPFLRRHAELLLLVDDQQAQVLELEAGAQHLVGADQDVDLPFFQPVLDVGDLFRRPQAAHVIDRAGESLEAGLEGFEVLEGEDGRRHQHGHLLGIADGLESSPDGHFRLAEAHVAADEAVHRAVVLHILLDRLRRPLLVGRILVHEGGFELFLEVGVGREGEALRGPALRIELDEFLGDVLDAGLGRCLHRGPGL